MNATTANPAKLISPKIVLFTLLLTCAQTVFAASQEITRQAPDTAVCERQKLCNIDLCTEVCAAGTVEVDPWVIQSLNFQRQIQRDFPLPYYHLPGTHNGYQTQHSGVGVEEQALHELFVAAGYEENNVVLQNQRYSVTDQLRMGLRWIEFDMWGFVFLHDDIRLCHDPFPDPRLLYWVEQAEKATGTVLNWDSANLGCFSKNNKNLRAGLQEVDAWLKQPGNEEEIVVIYYDAKTLFTPDQRDQAENNALEVFGDRIFTAAEKRELGRWPTAQELISWGKQVIVECNSDGYADSEVVFYPTLSSKANGGDQFGVDRFTPFPHCAIDGNPTDFSTGFFRPLDNSIAKGPVGQPAPQKMIGPEDIRNFLECGISTMALDNPQPAYMAEMIWSWDIAEPTGKGCVYMNDKGRWRVDNNCESRERYHACMNEHNRKDWTLSSKTDSWHNAGCPEGYTFSHPVNGYENALLRQLKGSQEVWIAFKN